MTTRKRKTTARSSSTSRQRRNKPSETRKSRRQHLLETLESRQLLAGPQLIGIQPNEGALIEDGSERSTAPRVLTFGFDEAQIIDSTTFEGIRITRSGQDGVFNTDDDVVIAPGLVTLGDPNQNEVDVRFVEQLPDDTYRIEVFGFDDAGLGITGLRNTNGELFVPSDPSQRSEIIEFDLKLGALVEAVVPQPVIRQDGQLIQNRNEIVVYFNEDPLFVENEVLRNGDGTIQRDADGNPVVGGPTERSAEHPRFYQLLFTQETVRTTDDLLFNPDQVVYDPATHTARLIFQGDINALPGVPQGGGTWRLRVGSAVEDKIDLSLPIEEVPVVASVVTDFQHEGLRVTFASRAIGESESGLQVRFVDTGVGTGGAQGATAELVGDAVVFDFRGATRTVGELQTAVALNPEVANLMTVDVELDGAVGIGSDRILPSSVLGATPLFLSSVGDTLETSFDVGILGRTDDLKTLLLTESITPQPFAVELIGGQDDPGHTSEVNHINPNFGADTPLRSISLGPLNDGVAVSDNATGDGFIMFSEQNVFTRFAAAPPLNDITGQNSQHLVAVRYTPFTNGWEYNNDVTWVPFTPAASDRLLAEVDFGAGTVIDLQGVFGNFNGIERGYLSGDISVTANQFAGVSDDGDYTVSGTSFSVALGVSEIAYNFNGVFDEDQVTGETFLNQINERQKVRIREALNLWSEEIGVQFRETQDEGITFALGDTNNLQSRQGLAAQPFGVLNASVRIDPTFQDSAIVFSNQADFQTLYGEDFTRKAVAGIGLMLGLNPASDLEAPTIMSLSPTFLNRTIDVLSSPDNPLNANPVQEPVFPNNEDILHGQFIHRPDSNDVDLYRFEVDLDDEDKVGTLTAETFAERLPDSSLLDTTLSLFQEVPASIVTDFGVGTSLAVEINSLVTGRNGNNSRLEVIRTDRLPNDTGVKIFPAFDESGDQLSNAVIVDIPRISGNITEVPASDVVDAINSSPLSASIFRARIAQGEATIDVGAASTSFSPLVLSGGGIELLSRNDDYFGEDSRIITSIGQGVYYLGVASTANEFYDPTITRSGFGGRTEGVYQLQIKFEPQVDETDVIRDLDNDRADVPGTILDGGGDGVPGGAHNFWFQTRPVNRIVNFVDDGDAVVPGQTVTVVGANNAIRTFEFVPVGSSPSPGNIEVVYSPIGVPTPAGNLASALQAAINARTGELGVSVSRNGASLEFTGERSLSFSDDFRAADVLGRNIFVDKSAGPQASGSLDRPFNNIANSDVANAFDAALPGDIVRIVGNGGLDDDITTENDNFSYQIGVSDVGGRTLDDGRNMEVPMGVTTMVDAGAVFKLRNSFIGVGSSTVQVDRSGGALQVLGTPRLVQLSAAGDPITTTLISGENSDDGVGYDDGSVIFTSIRDREVDAAAAGISSTPSPGNWGGLVYRRDIDRGEGRRDLEDEGIFLQRVNHAEIRYGGGSGVLIDSVQQLVNPIQIVNMRPTISFNEIRRSADSAISAAPDSFEESSYQAPVFQQAGRFTADYDRVGPEINNNHLIDNSINGLFIRATTTPTQTPREFTVAARLDDVDVVHYVAENLIVSSNPGGSLEDGFAPSMSLVSAQVLAGGTLAAGTYEYKVTFVDENGFESLASPDSTIVTVGSPNSSVNLDTLPQIGAESDYLSRRLYRATQGPNPEFRLVADLDASTPNFIDSGTRGEALLDLTRRGVRGRLDASLVMDPGLITKFRGARIELGHGTQLLAEGLASNPIVMTSSLDDRFGAGGTFDTNNDNLTVTGAAPAQRGDWSGIYAGPTSNISFDNVQLSYAGGISLIEGGLARGFLPLELQQANGRITNSVFSFNDSGQDGAGPQGRLGRLSAPPATIFGRGTQPIIVGNSFIDNRGSIIDLDIESFGANYRPDIGRQTGDIERFNALDDNFGPLIRLNRYLNDPASGSQLSGVEVRAGTIRTQTVFDDTDIAHLVFDNIEVGNFHSSGGLRLMSRPDESLVVKFTGEGSPNSETHGTGITATGSPGSIADRIGGSVHVIGLPGAPVILTSLNDDTAGAGLKPDGSQFTDHDGDGTNTRPFANDWRGILLDQFSNDTNVAVLPELELSTEVAPGLNGTVENAQFLGELAADELTSDHVRRLGFDVQGFLSNPNDVDTYSFIGSPGSEVWIDIDQTSFGLDTVIELLDENGEVLARSDNSADETALSNPDSITVFDPDLEGLTSSLQARNEQYTARGAGGLYEDFNSNNIYDAGIHFRLAGNLSDSDLRSVFFFRVRSSSNDPDDAQGGTTSGGYRFQVRLREDQEFPGSVVRFADIRYANHGIHVQGLMSTSPLLGEAQENEAATFLASNDTAIGLTLASGAQYIGNLVNNNNNVISVGGELGFANDIDFYQFDVNHTTGGAIQSAIFDIDYAAGFNRPDTNISVFYDPDGVDSQSFQPRLLYFGSSSNIADDLTSPNGQNSAIETLVRGSVSTDDPLIGPVNLPEGSYFVVVSSEGNVPAQLDSVREPVNSVDRIVEDRIDRINPESPSTANGPLLPRLFSDASIGTSTNFEITSDLSRGHGKPLHLDGSAGPVVFNGAPRIPEFSIGAGGDAADNLFLGVPVNSNLETLDWSVEDDPDIGGLVLLNGGPEFTATTIPHVSIVGDLRADPGDIYQFVVPDDGLGTAQRIILDIDGGYNRLADLDSDADGLVDTNTDPTSVDTTLVLLRETSPGNLIEVLRDTDNFLNLTNEGAAGSNSELDPFISTVQPPGNYWVVVVEGSRPIDGDLSDGFTLDTDNLITTAQTYTLHVSVGDHPLPPGSTTVGSGADVLSFDRLNNNTSGVITSESFDLAGYVAADKPTLYFNRIFQPVGNGIGLDDTATVTILSAENPTGTIVHTFQNPGQLAATWDQIRVPLDDFAGHSSIRLRVEYITNGQTANSFFNEFGLRLDDFVIGFAERGETVFNAPGDTTFVGNAVGNNVGEYQLEIRRGTDFATGGFNRSFLARSFDTNDRHNQSVTIVAPNGGQIADGQTFVLGDGAANQTFEFSTTGNVTFGNAPIRFDVTDSVTEIAESIRNAINAQTSIAIEAASSGGLDTQALTDGRLILSGTATGTFVSVPSDNLDPTIPFSVGPDGHLQIPAILHDGLGDENYLRRQGQVIVEHNVISDVRGIGVWSEPGERDINPTHDVGNPFITQPPLANSYPGAVRNLPTLNDSVLGGLAPGIVIRNNTIDQAEYAGIKIDGEVAPWSIRSPVGDQVEDGSTFIIDAAGTRVVFEFEDIGDGFPQPIPALYGSGVNGGDGVRDGHVPVYYRQTDSDTAFYLQRGTQYTEVEMLHAIMQSIQGSILMTNGLVELVTPYVGPSLVDTLDPGVNLFGLGSGLNFERPALYVHGASAIYWSDGTQHPDMIFAQAPIAEAPQPFARIVNNTIYGDDGRESATPQLAQVEPNDFLVEAIETNAGSSHRGAYTGTAVIGDSTGPLSGAGDVDFYQVFLEVGDRLIADVDTLDEDIPNGVPEGPDTVLRVFNASGIPQSFVDTSGNTVTLSNNDIAPEHLNPGSVAYPPDTDGDGTPDPIVDDVNTRDPFIDFTAPETGIYYVGVSSAGNDIYDPSSLADRTLGAGGTGTYQVGIEVFAPRSHVLSVSNDPPRRGSNNDNSDTGATLGAALQGTTFTVTLAQDLDPTLSQSDGTNRVEFIFDPGPPLVLGNGQVTVPIQDDYRVQDIVSAIEFALTGTLNGSPILPNGGPIPRVEAEALGGPAGGGPGTFNQLGLYAPDFNTGGFGHRRLTPASRTGSTELYVFAELISEIELSQEAAAAGLRLDPLPDRDTDQAINEAGVISAGGASTTLVNNVFLNLHESNYVEETHPLGFGRGDFHPKPGEVIIVGSVFQHDEPAPTQFQLDTFANNGTTSTGITTGNNEPSNINGGTDDFNVTLGNFDPAVQFAEAGNFQPSTDSILIDSSVASTIDRAALVTLRESVGLPISNIVAPNLDVAGILRADNPDFAPPGGIGSQVFIDRGSSELADFVGPIAIAEVPRDNDAEGIDTDPAVGFINLSDGIYEEFRIQLRDTGDSSDPFTGIGVDDSSVVVPAIDGLRSPGANITLFENERALIEGVDYTFNYGETKDVITLTPLTGIWRNDRSYRIALNNQDRNVLIASDPSVLADGDQFQITDDTGGTVVFEYETGYQLLMPEALTLTVPPQGTNAGGVRDGDFFQIDDGVRPPVVFEYNSDTAKLPGTVPIELPSGPTPLDADELAQFLNQIALNTQAAIQSEVDSGRLDIGLSVDGDTIVIGAERGATIAASTSGLLVAGRTLGLDVPVAGADLVNGVQVGETFEINNGSANVVFEFVDANNPATPGNIPVDLTSPTPMTQAQVAAEIQRAVNNSVLGLNTQIVDSTVFLNLPANGTAVVNAGQLRVVGVSRTPNDGDTIQFTPNDGTTPLVFELNRSDVPGLDGVQQNNFRIDVTRLTTATEMAASVANAVLGQVIGGLSPNEIQVGEDGLLTIGGQQGLGLAVSGSSLEVVGAPSVTDASTIEVFGPLLLNIPPIASLIQSGQVIIIQDDLGNDVLFEFVLNQAGFVQTFDGTPDANGDPTPVSNVVLFNTFDTNDIIANNLAAAINNAGIGINASGIGGGQVSLGRIDSSRVNTQGDVDAGIPGALQVTSRRGIVTDGEILTIRQGTTQVSFEFEEVTTGGGVTPGSGNIPVIFQAGSDVSDVASSLAAAINNNAGGLRVFAQIGPDNPGEVILNDIPGTVVDVTQAPTLNIVGVPGGAIPVRISAAFGPEEVAQSILNAINSVNVPGELPATTLSAEPRGGSTLFVENATLFSGAGIRTFFLPGIKDRSGNLLEPNRDDFSTQFTILLPEIGLDFGDAPDPVLQVAGRYPTRLVNDGPRHIVDTDLILGSTVDIDPDGRPVPLANGDDSVIEILTTGQMFSTSLESGIARIDINTGANVPNARDGDTITIDTGVARATLELDFDGIFNEDNFAIRPTAENGPEIANAIVAAINESPLTPANVAVGGNVVLISADDEDGVVFTSAENPNGILNRDVDTPITVTVTGAGVLEAWVDFNADGDWDEAGEQIISASTPGAVFSDTGGPVSRTFTIQVPDTTPDPVSPQSTYARFRISREGNLGPTGLALSGEVEDYVLLIVPGGPPVLTTAQLNRTFVTDENTELSAQDDTGSLSPNQTNDDGLLAGVVDPQGDDVAIIPSDTGSRDLFTPGGVLAGRLDLAANGTFRFQPAQDFNGEATFTARVTDLHPLDPTSQIVNNDPITVTISVQPINNRPQLADGITDVEISRTIDEDEQQIFDLAELVTPFFIPGPDNESDQPLILQSAQSFAGVNGVSSQGGTVEIINDGTQIRYTPPADANGPIPDTFTYRVADDVQSPLTSEEAVEEGTVSITINAVNDAPVVRQDAFLAQEDTPLTILINGDGTTAGILDNDSPGPANESSQTIRLITDGQMGFPRQTDQLGTIEFDQASNTLVYRPPPFFSGDDGFSYAVEDVDGNVAGLIETGRVLIRVGGVNNGPRFVGINGDPNATSLTFDESKETAQQFTFDLNAWFTDPELDDITFSVTSQNSSIVSPSLQGDEMTIVLPPFSFGETELVINATDTMGIGVVTRIPVTVNDTPDAPTLIDNGFDRLIGPEDQNLVADLGDVFFDPDAAPLNYEVTQLGNLIAPTDAQIANHPLIQSIRFVGDNMIITPQPNQSGDVEVTIRAFDNAFDVLDTFEVSITPVADSPVALGDSYNVPVGSQIQVLNPVNGLLANDTDPDGDQLTVDLSVSPIIQPTLGDLELNADGTFTYQNTLGMVGDVDTFTYRAVDTTTRTSVDVVVSLTLNRSRYQNPINAMVEDVTANGIVSPLDALRIINFLSQTQGEAFAGQVPVSEIGTPPPDFLDVNGDGTITTFDALLVINRLSADARAQRGTAGAGELVVTGSAQGEQIDTNANFAVTTAFANASSANLPVTNLSPVSEPLVQDESPVAAEDVRDQLLAGGIAISNRHSEVVTDAIVEATPATGSEHDEQVDAVIANLLDESFIDLDLSE